MQKQINEDDLVRIFSYKERAQKRHSLLFNIFYYGMFFCIFVIAVYVVVNYYALSSTLTFWYKSNFTTQIADDQQNINLTAPNVSATATDQWKTPVLANNRILIPVLDINAPITYGVDNTNSQVEENLKNGPIQINGTSLPGQTGNVYITGHSSNYVWIKSDYNSIFALLDKLVVGDLIYVNYNGTTYEYQVFDSKIVAADDTSILKSTSDSRLTLVTCWPVGTSLKRIVISANQIHPDPKLNTPPNTPANFQSLPSGR
jgi:sortase A